MTFHDVFVNGSVTAIRPTVAVAIVLLAVASLSCVLVISRRREPEQQAVPAEIAVA